MSFVKETPVFKIVLEGNSGCIIIKKQNQDSEDTILKFNNSLEDHDEFEDRSLDAMLVVLRALEEIEWGDNPDILFKQRIEEIIELYKGLLQTVSHLHYSTEMQNSRDSLKISIRRQLLRNFNAIMNCYKCTISGEPIEPQFATAYTRWRNSAINEEFVFPWITCAYETSFSECLSYKNVTVEKLCKLFLWYYACNSFEKVKYEALHPIWKLVARKDNYQCTYFIFVWYDERLNYLEKVELAIGLRNSFLCSTNDMQRSLFLQVLDLIEFEITSKTNPPHRKHTEEGAKGPSFDTMANRRFINATKNQAPNYEVAVNVGWPPSAESMEAYLLGLMSSLCINAINAVENIVVALPITVKEKIATKNTKATKKTKVNKAKAAKAVKGTEYFKLGQSISGKPIGTRTSINAAVNDDGVLRFGFYSEIFVNGTYQKTYSDMKE